MAAKKTLCGGSLISKSHVLTAVHCLNRIKLTDILVTNNSKYLNIKVNSIAFNYVQSLSIFGVRFIHGRPHQWARLGNCPAQEFKIWEFLCSQFRICFNYRTFRIKGAVKHFGTVQKKICAPQKSVLRTPMGSYLVKVAKKPKTKPLCQVKFV